LAGAPTLKRPTQSSWCQIVVAIRDETRAWRRRGAENVSDGAIVAYAKAKIYMRGSDVGRSRLDRSRLQA
jgi:hypothetical protein